MGNRGMSACPGSVTVDTDETSLSLTPRQIDIVRENWGIIEQNIGPNGVVIFNKLFELCPEIKSLFPKIVLINEDNKLAEEIDMKMLLRHATTVMEGIGATVESLDDTYVLDSVLVSLGQTHARHNVREHMLKKLWPALNYGLKAGLGSRYNKEAVEAWKTLFQYICMRMRQGMTEAAN